MTLKDSQVKVNGKEWSSQCGDLSREGFGEEGGIGLACLDQIDNGGWGEGLQYPSPQKLVRKFRDTIIGIKVTFRIV